MAEVKVFHDREGQTLTVWFTDPQQEFIAEETGDEVVLMKDRLEDWRGLLTRRTAHGNFWQSFRSRRRCAVPSGRSAGLRALGRRRRFSHERSSLSSDSRRSQFPDDVVQLRWLE